MPLYLYSYLEMMGVLGCDTPQRPGTDFGMSVWIETGDESQARVWGKRILEEFVRERFRFSSHKIDPTVFEGDIETDPETLEESKNVGIPVCRIGEIPVWVEPWKSDVASGNRTV